MALNATARGVPGGTPRAGEVQRQTPAVEAIQKGRSVRYITLLVPASGHPRPVLKSFRAFTGGYQITLKLGGNGGTVEVGVIGHEGSTVVVVMNSLRLLLRR